MEYGLYRILFFNQFVDPIALKNMLKNIQWKFYLVFVVVLEISKLFDGDGADVVEAANAEVSGKMKLDQTGDTTMIEDVANIKA
ncbi:hypothetical protein CONLIGDRAFT_682040 [Coniochaeta ligniaria NRRL 30616]|uniref:Uncharacterized protein n=1 Tax=Coniochaeta ligniaria NRRL 30616 TaxID=1408157 RepID=A0A1J7IPK4_9PEZI|nr:hypothetical protein CONLIGDRAFT_682040 [Coniochaeta ligniaria NRRL 30616]